MNSNQTNSHPGRHVSDATVGDQLSPGRDTHLCRALVHDTHILEDSHNRYRHGSCAQSTAATHVVRTVVSTPRQGHTTTTRLYASHPYAHTQCTFSVIDLWRVFLFNQTQSLSRVNA
jgi:hypothetical protein